MSWELEGLQCWHSFTRWKEQRVIEYMPQVMENIQHRMASCQTILTYRDYSDFLLPGRHCLVPSQSSIIWSSVRDQYEVVRCKRSVTVPLQKHCFTSNSTRMMHKRKITFLLMNCRHWIKAACAKINDLRSRPRPTTSLARFRHD